ncbi:MAG: hypothetical protein ACP6IY_20915 [Promethearchaeia archaeon]
MSINLFPNENEKAIAKQLNKIKSTVIKTLTSFLLKKIRSDNNENNFDKIIESLEDGKLIILTIKKVIAKLGSKITKIPRDMVTEIFYSIKNNLENNIGAENNIESELESEISEILKNSTKYQLPVGIIGLPSDAKVQTQGNTVKIIIGKSAKRKKELAPIVGCRTGKPTVLQNSSNEVILTCAISDLDLEENEEKEGEQ